MDHASHRPKGLRYPLPHGPGANDQDSTAMEWPEMPLGPLTPGLGGGEGKDLLGVGERPCQAPLSDLLPEGFVVPGQQGPVWKPATKQVGVHSCTGAMHPGDPVKFQVGRRAESQVGIGPFYVGRREGGTFGGADLEGRQPVLQIGGIGVTIAIDDQEALRWGRERGSGHEANGKGRDAPGASDGCETEAATRSGGRLCRCAA